MKRILLLLITILFIWSCNGKWEILNRKYRSGFEIHHSTNRKHQEKIATINSNKLTRHKIPDQIQSEEIWQSQSNPQLSKPVCTKPLPINKHYTEKTFANAHHHKEPYTFHTKKNKKTISNRKPSTSKDDLFIAMFAGIGISAGIAYSQRQKLKYATRWASKNIWKSRLIIAGFSIVNSIVCYHLGKIFQAEGIQLSKGLIAGGAAGMGLAHLLFRKTTAENMFSSVQVLKNRIAKLLLPVSAALIVTSVSNTNTPGMEAVMKLVPYTQQINKIYQPIKTVANNSVDEITIEEDTKALKIFLTVLISIFIGATCAVAIVLSCALVCSGQEGLAALVIIVGIPAAILIGIFGIRQVYKIHIYRKVPLN